MIDGLLIKFSNLSPQTLIVLILVLAFLMIFLPPIFVAIITVVAAVVAVKLCKMQLKSNSEKRERKD